jgi:hypothetical protein
MPKVQLMWHSELRQSTSAVVSGGQSVAPEGTGQAGDLVTGIEIPIVASRLSPVEANAAPRHRSLDMWRVDLLHEH